MTNAADDEAMSAFSIEVGQRLRAVRRGRGLSLDDVERKSGGRWSASAIGAYERGFRNLSLPRLHELAQFYEVRMTELIGESRTPGQGAEGTSPLVIDLEALGQAPDAAAPIARYLKTIIEERGDFNGRVLSVRRDDIRALCVICECTETELFETLGGWRALLSEGSEVKSAR